MLHHPWEFVRVFTIRGRNHPDRLALYGHSAGFMIIIIPTTPVLFGIIPGYLYCFLLCNHC